MKDQIPLKPEKEESGELFIKSWWYKCPACGDPLDYKQKRCGYCEQRIDWGGETE